MQIGVGCLRPWNAGLRDLNPILNDIAANGELLDVSREGRPREGSISGGASLTVGMERKRYI